MNELATIGHNGAPDPIDLAVEPFQDYIDEATNWMDGEAIDLSDMDKAAQQVEAVEVLIKEIVAAKKHVEACRKEITDPLNKAFKDEVARWKPTQADIERMQKGLQNLIAPVKAEQHRIAQEAKRIAYLEAQRAEEEARAAEAAAMAEGSDIDAMREADDLKSAALDKAKEAQQASRDGRVTGMKTVHEFEILSGQELINWIIENDRAAINRFLKGYVEATPHQNRSQIGGVRAWSKKVPK